MIPVLIIVGATAKFLNMRLDKRKDALKSHLRMTAEADTKTAARGNQ